MAFGPTSGPAADVRGEALRWVRRAVDGESVEGGARLFVMGLNEWRDFTDWPPPATETDLYLGSGGALRSPEAPPTRSIDTFDYDPHDPVPTRGGRALGPFLPMAGPVDQRPVESAARRPRLYVRSPEPRPHGDRAG